MICFHSACKKSKVKIRKDHLTTYCNVWHVRNQYDRAWDESTPICTSFAPQNLSAFKQFMSNVYDASIQVMHDSLPCVLSYKAANLVRAMQQCLQDHIIFTSLAEEDLLMNILFRLARSDVELLDTVKVRLATTIQHGSYATVPYMWKLSWCAALPGMNMSRLPLRLLVELRRLIYRPVKTVCIILDNAIKSTCVRRMLNTYRHSKFVHHRFST